MNANKQGSKHVASSSSLQPPEPTSSTSKSSAPPFSLLNREDLKWRNLTKSLYVEIVLDGARNATAEGIRKLVKVFEWMTEGSINEKEFSELYSVWLNSSQDKPVRVISVSEFREAIADYNINKLDLWLGILTNEHNRNFQQQMGVNKKWIQVVEHLFFFLDSLGNGFITIDEIHFFMMALLGEEANSLTPEQLLSRTNDFMKEVGPFEGVITLKRFKEFFHKNKLDVKTIQSTIQCLEAEAAQWKSFNAVTMSTVEPGIPRIWEQCIFGLKQELPNHKLSKEYELYLLTDSHHPRHLQIKKLFTPKGATLVLQFFLENNKLGVEDEVQLKLHPLFPYTTKVLEKYKSSLKFIIESFFPSIKTESNTSFSSVNISLGLQSPPMSVDRKPNPRPQPSSQPQPNQTSTAASTPAPAPLEQESRNIETIPISLHPSAAAVNSSSRSIKSTPTNDTLITTPSQLQQTPQLQPVAQQATTTETSAPRPQSARPILRTNSSPAIQPEVPSSSQQNVQESTINKPSPALSQHRSEPLIRERYPRASIGTNTSLLEPPEHSHLEESSFTRRASAPSVSRATFRDPSATLPTVAGEDLKSTGKTLETAVYQSSYLGDTIKNSSMMQSSFRANSSAANVDSMQVAPPFLSPVNTSSPWTNPSPLAPSTLQQQDPPLKPKHSMTPSRPDAAYVPFDVDMLIRNAEWKDIRQDNMEKFSYLEVRNPIRPIPLHLQHHYTIVRPAPQVPERKKDITDLFLQYITDNKEAPRWLPSVAKSLVDTLVNYSKANNGAIPTRIVASTGATDSQPPAAATATSPAPMRQSHPAPQSSSAPQQYLGPNVDTVVTSPPRQTRARGATRLALSNSHPASSSPPPTHQPPKQPTLVEDASSSTSRPAPSSSASPAPPTVQIPIPAPIPAPSSVEAPSKPSASTNAAPSSSNTTANAATSGIVLDIKDDMDDISQETLKKVLQLIKQSKQPQQQQLFQDAEVDPEPQQQHQQLHPSKSPGRNTSRSNTDYYGYSSEASSTSRASSTSSRKGKTPTRRLIDQDQISDHHQHDGSITSRSQQPTSAAERRANSTGRALSANRRSEGNASAAGSNAAPGGAFKSSYPGNSTTNSKRLALPQVNMQSYRTKMLAARRDRNGALADSGDEGKKEKRWKI